MAHTSNFVTIVSINDDRVPLDKALNLQKKLGAELIEETAGHFRESDGYIALEPALQSVLKMAS
jgi:predicted alpha/beta hydrolase family esterase